MESYRQFMDKHLTDRASQSAYLDTLMENEPYFKGMEKGRVGRIMANVTGFEPLKRFEQNAFQRSMDWLGTTVNEGMTNLTPGQLLNSPVNPVTLPYRMATGKDITGDAIDKPFSEHTGNVAEATAKTFGASDSTAQAFRTAGEGVPNIVGQMSMAAIPYAGLPLMFGSMYGQGLDQAYQQGEFGFKSVVSGVTGPAISALTMGLARPLGSAASNQVMKIASKLTGGGAAEAIKDGMQIGGELGLKSVIGSKMVDAGTKALMKVGQETLVETAQAGIGIAGEVAQAAVLDPKEFFTQTVFDKQFWIPVIASEVIEGVGGTIIGRVHNPLEQKLDLKSPDQMAEDIAGEYEKVAQEKAKVAGDVEALKKQKTTKVSMSQPLGDAISSQGRGGSAMTFTSPADIVQDPTLWAPTDFSDLVYKERNVDPADPDADAKVLEHDQNVSQTASGEVAKATAEARTMPETVPAFVDPDTGRLVKADEVVAQSIGLKIVHVKPDDPRWESPPEVEPQLSVHVTEEEAVAQAASSFNAKSEVPVGVPATLPAQIHLGNVDFTTPPDVPTHKSKARYLERLFDGSLKANKDHRIMTVDGDQHSYIGFRNPGTKVHGVFTHLVRNVNGEAKIVNPSTIVRYDDLRKIHMLESMNAGSGKVYLDNLFKTPLTETEYAAFRDIANNAKAQEAQIPYGVSFAEGHDIKYAEGWMKLLQQSGIQDALVRARVKLRFGAIAHNVSMDTLKASPLDYFATADQARNVEYTDNVQSEHLHYITRYRGKDKKSAYISDLHEVGHTVGWLLGRGHFGAEVAQQWRDAVKHAGALAQTDKLAGARGVDMQLEAGRLAGASEEVLSPSGMREHLSKLTEIEAQTFQGYMLEQDNPWKGFVKKHFPKLHQFFIDLVARIKGSSVSDEMFDYKMNLYSPGYTEMRMILKGLFDNNYKNSVVAAQRLRAIKRSFKLRGTNAETVLMNAWQESNTREGHAAINDAITAWSKGLVDPKNVSAVEEQDLISMLEYVRKMNETNIEGFSSIEDVFGAMPWIRRLRANEVNIADLRDRLVQLAKASKSKNILDGAFLTPEEYANVTAIANNMPQLSPKASAAEKKAHKAAMAEWKAAVRLLDRRNKFVMNLRFVGVAVDEMFAELGEHRLTPGAVAKEMFQIDNAVKAWLLGRLPGQRGIPMHEPNSNLSFKEMMKNSQLVMASRKEDRKQYLHTVHTNYPILTKAIKAAVTASKKESVTYVKHDGTIVFGRQQGRNTKRRFYANENEASGAAAVMKQQNPQLNFIVESYKTKKSGEQWVIRVNKVADKSVDSSYIDDFDPDAAQDMVRAATAEDGHEWAGQQMRGEDDFVRTPEQVALRKKRASKLAPTRPQLMRTANIIATEFVSRQHAEDRLPAKLNAIENRTFTSFLEDGKFRNIMIEIGKGLGLVNVDEPIQVAQAYIDRYLHKYTTENQRLAIERIINATDVRAEQYLHSYLAYAREYVDNHIEAKLGEWLSMESNNMLPEVDPSELGAGARGANANIMMDPQVGPAVTAATRSLPGGISNAPHALTQIKNIGLKILGKPLKAVDELHAVLGQGVIHRALSDKDFIPLGELVHRERGYAQAMADEAISPLFIEGEVKTFRTQGKDIQRFVANANGKVDKESPILRIQADPVQSQLHNDLIRLEQYNHMKFADMLTHTQESVRKPAQELLTRIPDAWRKTHELANLRRYSAQELRSYRIVQSDRKNHVASFAYLLSLESVFDGNADKVHDFAKRFKDSVSVERIQLLVHELNKTPEEATRIAERFSEHEDALLKKWQYMMEHPEHVSEKRFKDWHVSVVFKKGYQPKGGVKVKADKPIVGYYDFDTREEAVAFIADMKKQGHKPIDNPKDFKRQRFSYTPASGTLEDIMQRVVQSNKDLISTILYGKVTQEDLGQIETIMDHTVTDIVDENNAAVATKSSQIKRAFHEGRENLDMLEQYMTDTRRLAASMARKETDVMFKLFGRDQRMQSKKAMFDEIDRFKDQARLPDTDAQRQIAQAGFFMFMAGNVSSGLVELFQFPMVLSPVLIEHGASVKDAYGIPSKLFKRATQAAIERLRTGDDTSIWSDPKNDPDGEILGLIREAGKQGASAQLRHMDISLSKVDRLVEMYQANAQELGVTGLAKNSARSVYDFMNRMYGGFNQINAELALASTFMVLKKQKYGANAKLDKVQLHDLYQKTMMLTDVANGSLQRLGRPAWFNNRNPKIRAALSMYWSLQSFVNAQVANQIRFMRKSIDAERQWTPAERTQAKKAFAGLLGVQLLGVGTMGFTLAPALGKLIEMAFGVDLEDEIRDALYDENGETQFERNFMGELATNGLLSAVGLPFDYGTRVSVAGVGPLSGFEGFDPSQMGGPLVGLATQAFKDMTRVRAGNMDLDEAAAMNLLPMGLRRAARLAFFDDGKVYDANKQFLFSPTFGEALGMTAGFSPMRARKEMKMRMEKYEAMESDKKAYGSRKNEILKTMDEGSIERMHELVNRTAREFNKDPYEVYRDSAEFATNKKLGPNIREGAGPAAMRASRLYPSPLGPDNHVQRLNETAQTMMRMGVTPRISRASMMRASALDAMQQLNPELPTGYASKLIAQDPMRTRQFFNQGRVSSLQELLQDAGVE